MGTPPPAGVAPVWQPTPVWGSGYPSPQSREADRLALADLKVSAIVAIVGTALGLLVPLVAAASGYYSLTVASSGTALPQQTALYVVLGSSVVGLVVAVLSLWYMRSGFRRLAGIDSRFSTTATWVLLALVGIVVIAIGLVVTLVSTVQLISCAVGNTTIPSGCVSFDAVIAGVGLDLVGALLLLIGGIGTVIGIWRLGDRYGDSLFKVAAILLIFLGIVGAILLFVAVRRAEGTILSQPTLTYTPTAPPPPTPPTSPWR